MKKLFIALTVFTGLMALSACSHARPQNQPSYQTTTTTDSTSMSRSSK